MDVLPARRPSIRRVAAIGAVALVAAGWALGRSAGVGAAVASGTPPVDAAVAPDTSLVAPPAAPGPEPPAETPPPAPTPDWPDLPEGSGEGRRVVYANSQQRVWIVEEEGAVVRSWLVSGRRGVPRPGTYQVFSTSRHTSARGGRVRMEFMVRFARGRSLAIGFHSIPVTRSGRPIQGEDELGRFRSAGCVRQRYEDAAFLWDWAPVGTTVVVTR